MIKALVVEDEKLARKRIKRLIASVEDVEIIGEAENGEDAIELINKLKPDLIFLDINLPEIKGTELVKYLTHFPQIIFTTAYDNYAIKAFELGAIDYLLKPLTLEKIQRAVDRVQMKKKENQKKDFHEFFKLYDSLKEEKRFIETISMKVGNSFKILNVLKINLFKAEDRYVNCFTGSKEYITDMTIKELETKLDGSKFIQIQRGIIVRIDSVIEVKRSLFFNGYELIVENIKEPQPIGKTYLKKVKTKFGF